MALGDQVLSGVSNLLTVALVARSLSVESFGSFSIAYALLVGALSFTRAFWGTRLALTLSVGAARREASGLLAATVMVSPVLALLVWLPTHLVAGGDDTVITVLIALALPVVVAQDICRYTAVATDRAWVATLSDGLWVAAVLVGYIARPSAELAVAWWLVSAVAALVVALAVLRVIPTLSEGWAALRRRHSTGEVNAVAQIGFLLASYATLGLASASLGVAAAGSLRGASTAMAPVNALFAFSSLALLPMVFRRPLDAQRGVVRGVALALAALATAWGIVLLLIPSGVGALLLGDTWAGSRGVLPWTVLEYAGLALVVGFLLGLQARQEARPLLTVTLSQPVVVVVAVAVAATMAESAAAFAAAAACATVVNAGVAWFVYEYRSRAPARRGTPASD